MEKENREESYFNKILEKLKNNELDNNYIIDLGKPGAILKECGFPDKKIEMNAGRLLMKAQLSRHPFELEDIKDFDKSLQEPVAVFSYGSENYGRDVIVNLKKDDKNFLAGISFNTDNEQLKVSSVRTIFPKDNIEWLNWINQGKLIYCDKKEIQALSAQLQMNFADVSNQDNRTSSVTYCLDSLDSILDKFENSKQIYTKKYPFYEEIRAKNDSEYFLYRDSYIAKSKLLYEESLKLYNEIPYLLIGEEIREQFYLLPYGYAMDKNLKFRKFADALNKNIFTDFKGFMEIV